MRQIAPDLILMVCEEENTSMSQDDDFFYIDTENPKKFYFPQTE